MPFQSQPPRSAKSTQLLGLFVASMVAPACQEALSRIPTTAYNRQRVEMVRRWAPPLASFAAVAALSA